MPARPRDGQQKRALFKGLHVMRDALIQCEQTAGVQIERPALGRTWMWPTTVWMEIRPSV